MAPLTAVLDLLTEGPRSVKELGEELGLSTAQIINAVQSHRLRKIVQSGRGPDGRRVYSLNTERHTNSKSNLPTLTDAILALLANHGAQVLRSAAIATELEGKVNSSASNFQGAVAATLSTLVKAGKIARHEDGYTSI